MTKQKNKIVWNNVRNLYVEWVSKTELRNFFSNELLINGFSLWWVTTLVSKDNVNNKTIQETKERIKNLCINLFPLFIF